MSLLRSKSLCTQPGTTADSHFSEVVSRICQLLASFIIRFCANVLNTLKTARIVIL